MSKKITRLCPVPTRTYINGLMRRCQEPPTGRYALDNAIGVLASVHGALDRLMSEVERQQREIEMLRAAYRPQRSAFDVDLAA